MRIEEQKAASGIVNTKVRAALLVLFSVASLGASKLAARERPARNRPPVSLWARVIRPQASGECPARLPRTRPGTRPTAGDPIDLATGLYTRTDIDLELKDDPPIVFSRTYRNADQATRAFGIGTSHSYDLFLFGNSRNFSWIAMILPDGGRIPYVRVSPGTGFADAVLEHTSTPSEFYKSRLSWAHGKWEARLRDGSLYSFLACSPTSTRPGQCGLVLYKDRLSRAINIARDANGNVTEIMSPHSMWVRLGYDGSSRIVTAKDSLGRNLSYRYDPRGRLITVMTPDGGLKLYAYDKQDRMIAIHEVGPDFNFYIENKYDSAERCIEQRVSDGNHWKFNYILGSRGNVKQTEVTHDDPLQRKVATRRLTFNESGYAIDEVRDINQPGQVSISYHRQPGTNLAEAVTVACASHGRLLTETSSVVAGETEEMTEDRLLERCQ